MKTHQKYENEYECVWLCIYTCVYLCVCVVEVGDGEKHKKKLTKNPNFKMRFHVLKFRKFNDKYVLLKWFSIN